MNRYDIRIYDDREVKSVRFTGWKFPTKEDAREFGVDRAKLVFPDRTVSVWVSFMGRVAE